MSVETVIEYLLFGIAAIRTVAKGHQLVAEGHKLVADGWMALEGTVGELGLGELPQLLRRLKSSLTPTPTPTAMKEEVEKMEEELAIGEEEEGASTSGLSVTPVSQGGPESPITIQIKTPEGNRTYKYKCPQCDHVKISKRGMDSHIRQVHTLKPFVCSLCDFTSYNLDSMQRHEKVHK